jgi:hypothetical protein
MMFSIAKKLRRLLLFKIFNIMKINIKRKIMNKYKEMYK